MGTRADFYIGRGQEAVWLGSIAYDGYPEGITPKSDKREIDWPSGMGPAPYQKEPWAKGESLLDATTEEQFCVRLERYFLRRDDVTRPADGWPWPWDDSRTTDYVYALDGGQVWRSYFGGEWLKANEKQPEDDGEVRPKTAVFPNMKSIQRVTFGERSGLLILGTK